MCGCGAYGHIVVMGLSRAGWGLGWVIMKVFSNLNEPMILGAPVIF